MKTEQQRIEIVNAGTSTKVDRAQFLMGALQSYGALCVIPLACLEAMLEAEEKETPIGNDTRDENARNYLRKCGATEEDIEQIIGSVERDRQEALNDLRLLIADKKAGALKVDGLSYNKQKPTPTEEEDHGTFVVEISPRQ